MSAGRRPASGARAALGLLASLALAQLAVRPLFAAPGARVGTRAGWRSWRRVAGLEGLRATGASALEGENGTSALEEPPALAEAEEWKRQLLRFCAASNRGLGASAADSRRALELVEKLESSFQAPESAGQRQEAIAGSWAIVYTTSPDLTSLRTLPLPGWSTARIGQSFLPNMDATNEIEFVSPLGSRVDQTVQCKWKLVQPDADSFKVELLFAGSSTKLREVMGFEPPVPPLTLPLPPAAGVFEVSFVDQDLLVQRLQPGRRGLGGVNVLVRQ